MSFDDFSLHSNDEWFSPHLWDIANCSLTRQISIDASQQPLWNSSFPTQTEISSIASNYHTDSETNHQDLSIQSSGKKVQKKDPNYEKNICAYITKKAVQCFLSPAYRKVIERKAVKYGACYAEMHKYYSERYEQVFGITHLALLITPQQQREIKMKRCFREYLKWFLREKYMFYLLKYGKMSEKEKYISFKNKYLLFVDQQSVSMRSNSITTINDCN